LHLARTDLPAAEFKAGVRASLPLLLGVTPFGVVTGVAMSAGGIPPLAAVAMSLFVFAGASMLAMTQLVALGSPVLVVVVTALFVNLRFMMYSASLRLHLAGLPLRWRALVGYLLADNPYAVCIARFSQHASDPLPAKLAYYLGVSVPIWFAWQVAVFAGIAAGAALPAAWKLEFAAPLAFIAISVPLIRDRSMLAAAVCAGATAVLAHALPLKLGLALAALAGIAAGLACDRYYPREAPA
jgi:predicted branched-subunit amino acid permease